MKHRKHTWVDDEIVTLDKWLNIDSSGRRADSFWHRRIFFSDPLSIELLSPTEGEFGSLLPINPEIEVKEIEPINSTALGTFRRFVIKKRDKSKFSVRFEILQEDNLNQPNTSPRATAHESEIWVADQRIERFDVRQGQWIQIGDLPLNVEDTGIVSIGDNIFLFGGGVAGDQNKAAMYSISLQTWTSLPNLPEGISRPIVTTDGDKIWIISNANFKMWEFSDGYTQITTVPITLDIGDAWYRDGKIYVTSTLANENILIYDLKNHTWSSSSAAPGHGWLLSASDKKGCSYLRGRMFTSSYQFDEWLDSIRLRSMGANPSANATLAKIDEHVYDFGGSGDSTCYKTPFSEAPIQFTDIPYDLGYFGTATEGERFWIFDPNQTNSIFFFDPGLNEWKSFLSSAFPTSGHCRAFFWDLKFYILVSGAEALYLYVLDPLTASLELQSTYPFQDFYGSCQIGSLIFLLGNNPASTSFFAIDLASKDQTSLSDFPFEIQASSLIEHGGFIWSFGGKRASGEGVGDIYRYSLATNSWSLITSDPALVGGEVYRIGNLAFWVSSELRIYDLRRGIREQSWSSSFVAAQPRGYWIDGGVFLKNRILFMRNEPWSYFVPNIDEEVCLIR